MSGHRDGVMFQSFCWDDRGDGGFWKQLQQRAEALAEAGFSLVWLPPPCKGADGADDMGYAIYDLFDLGEFDQKGGVRTRWGTRAEFEAAVAALRDAGLVAVADIVLNHKMGADGTETFLAQRVNPENRLEAEGEPRDIEAWTRFTFDGRGTTYSDFGWRWHHFASVDTVAPAEGEDPDQPAIYRVLNKEFADDVGQEMGNYDFLLGNDLNLNQKDVRGELFYWGRWFLDQTGIDGLRIDAAKHMSARFLKDFLGHVRHETARDVFAVAEYAIADVAAIERFLADCEGATHCFDFPLKFRFKAAAEDADAFDLRTLFDDTLVSVRPDLAVTFVDNHDSDPAQAGEGWIDDWFKPLAYAAILLRRDGLPCVFRGDYDGRETQPALTDHGPLIDRLLEARRRFNFGDQLDHFEHERCIAWTRTGDEQHPGAMVVVLSTEGARQLKLKTPRPHTRFVSLLLDDAQVQTDDDGVGEFGVPKDGLAVWVVDEADG